MPFPTSSRRPGALGDHQPGAAFESFLQRDALREKRRKSRRNTLVISLLVHGIALAMVVLYSMWDVEELFGPSVKVKVYSRSAAPAAVLAPREPAPPHR